MSVEAIFYHLVPYELRGDTTNILVRAIEIANQHTRDKWAIRVSEAHGVMLHVGFHEVLQILNGEIAHFIFDRSTIPKNLRDDGRYEFSGDCDWNGNPGSLGYYRSNPGTEACDTELRYAKGIFDKLEGSFEQVVERAVKTRRRHKIEEYHSIGFVEFLAKESGLDLPQPAFVHTREPASPFTDEPLVEGATQQRLSTSYERNTEARKKCLNHYGYTCSACGVRLEEIYGDIGRGVIHVHHLTPISSSDGEHEVNPIEDLRPVCPNCHAVMHSKVPPYTIDEVKRAIRSRGG